MPAQLIEASTPLSLDSISALLGGSRGGAASIPHHFTSLTSSTKLIRQGALFVALAGSKFDGHDFIRDAIGRGAGALVLQRDRVRDGDLPAHFPHIIVPNTHKALSELAKLFSGSAADRLTFIGITGTNGKTTTTWITYHALLARGIAALRVGTLGVAHPRGLDLPGALTTPDPCELHDHFRSAEAAGISHVVMEVSSHALDQARVVGIPFKIGVFTNLTRDHLDYHPTMQAYFEAKCKLFDFISERWGERGTAVINRSDSYGEALLSKCSSLPLTNFSFGYGEGNNLKLRSSALHRQGSTFLYSVGGALLEIHSPLLGDHNLENIAASIGCMHALGVSLQDIAPLYASIPQVPGRLELVHGGDSKVFVDYAHSPDALERVLVTLRKITEHRLWVLFGCGGDRDRGKRTQMAEVAARYADRVVVTSDNPRTEDPHSIIEEILSGAEGPKIRAQGLVEVDRSRAISLMLENAEKGDVFLIAGKGHEDYQIIGTKKLPFSDQSEVRQFFGEAP